MGRIMFMNIFPLFSSAFLEDLYIVFQRLLLFTYSLVHHLLFRDYLIVSDFLLRRAFLSLWKGRLNKKFFHMVKKKKKKTLCTFICYVGAPYGTQQINTYLWEYKVFPNMDSTLTD